MTFVHIHLMASHIPVIGMLLLLPLLLFALLKRSDELAKAGLWGLVLLGIAAAAVYLTGEPTEEGVESLAGIAKPMIDQHEEAALIATILLCIAGVLALYALYRSRKMPLSRGVVVTALLTAFGISGVFAYTANLGGKIRHSEITNTTSAPRIHDSD